MQHPMLVHSQVPKLQLPHHYVNLVCFWLGDLTVNCRFCTNRVDTSRAACGRMAATAPQLPGDSMIAYRASYVIQTYARAVEPVNFTPFSLAWRNTTETDTVAAEFLYHPRLSRLGVDVKVILRPPYIFCIENH